MKTFNVNATAKSVDKYGRDLTLRVNPYLARFKGMSWLDITILLEDEQEEKMREQRRKLQSVPNYELEEGEVLE